MPVEELSLYFGLDDTKQIDLSFIPTQKRKIKTVSIHPSYRYPASYYDVAILELQNPVKLTATIHPVCLPKFSNPNPNSLSRQSGTFVGHGPENDNSTTLKQVTQKILPQQSCNAIYNPNTYSSKEN